MHFGGMGGMCFEMRMRLCIRIFAFYKMTFFVKGCVEEWGSGEWPRSEEGNEMRGVWWIFGILMMGCSGQPSVTSVVGEAERSQDVCPTLEEPPGVLYESWHDDASLLHGYEGGLEFEVGRPESQKYMERADDSPWLEVDEISPERAKADKLEWASGELLRWLSGESTTLHFPFYPEDWPGDLYVDVALRPKNNASMAVRFYRPDGDGGRVWSSPLTTDLKPGWRMYRWRVPREWLSPDGMQWMRVSFPGSYFEGSERVSAKFVRMSFGVGKTESGNGPWEYSIEPRTRREKMADVRVLDVAKKSLMLGEDTRYERFFVVPDGAVLAFDVAPSAWLEAPGVFHVDVQTDGEKASLESLHLEPGACWSQVRVDLSRYAGEGVRVSMYFESGERDNGFGGDDRPRAYLSAPEIRVDGTSFEKARAAFAHSQRIVVLAVDNLRADRIFNVEKRRGTPNLSRLADAGFAGVLLGEGKSLVATTASFLTGLGAEAHGVREPGVHVRQSWTTLAESLRESGWRTRFWSTSSLIDAGRGFAQGFEVIEGADKSGGTREVLGKVGEMLRQGEDKSFDYVHLSQLRLPYRAPAEKLAAWGVPGYSGGVTPVSMQNVVVMSNPDAEDIRQIEAYYDGELWEVDEAIGEFVQTLDEGTTVVVFGTHGNSLGEAAIGYEQGLVPWELLMPFVVYRKGASVGVRSEYVARAGVLSDTVREMAGLFVAGRTVFDPHDSRPLALGDGMAATATWRAFYRIRREGVDGLFLTGIERGKAERDAARRPVLRQSMREKIR